MEAAQQKLPLWSARTVCWNRHGDGCYNNAPKAGVLQGCTEQRTSGASAWPQHATIHWVRGSMPPGPRYQCIVYTNHPHMLCTHTSQTHAMTALVHRTAGLDMERWRYVGIAVHVSERYDVHGHCLCSSGYLAGQHVTHEYVRINRIARGRLWPNTPQKPNRLVAC